MSVLILGNLRKEGATQQTASSPLGPFGSRPSVEVEGLGSWVWGLGLGSGTGTVFFLFDLFHTCTWLAAPPPSCYYASTTVLYPSFSINALSFSHVPCPCLALHSMYQVVVWEPSLMTILSPALWFDPRSMNLRRDLTLRR